MASTRYLLLPVRLSIYLSRTVCHSLCRLFNLPVTYQDLTDPGIALTTQCLIFMCLSVCVLFACFLLGQYVCLPICPSAYPPARLRAYLGKLADEVGQSEAHPLHPVVLAAPRVIGQGHTDVIFIHGCGFFVIIPLPVHESGLGTARLVVPDPGTRRKVEHASRPVFLWLRSTYASEQAFREILQ